MLIIIATSKRGKVKIKIKTSR